MISGIVSGMDGLRDDADRAAAARRWRWVGISFLVGGVVDAVFGTAILIAAEPAAPLLRVTLPTPPIYLDLNGLFLVALGAMYLMIWREPKRLAPIAAVATLLRFGGFALFLGGAVLGRGDPSFKALALVDGVLAIVHLALLRSAAGSLVAAFRRAESPTP